MNKHNNNKKTVKMSDYLNKVFNGQHRNYMYFHEKYRHIAVVFTYNLKTGIGSYSASICRYIPGNPENKSWDKKSHRETAIQRFDKCRPVSFQIPFEVAQNVFYPKLKKQIRKTIMKLGVKGVRGGNSQETSPMTYEITTPAVILGEIVPYQTRIAT